MSDATLARARAALRRDRRRGHERARAGRARARRERHRLRPRGRLALRRPAARGGHRARDRATTRPTCRPGPSSSSPPRSRRRTRSGPSGASAASASCTAPRCWASSPACARRSRSPARTARRRRRACSSMPCAAAGSTRATSSAAPSARRAPTPAGGRGSGSWSRPTSPTARCSSSSPRSRCSPTPSSTTTRRTPPSATSTTPSGPSSASPQRAAVIWDRPALLALAPAGLEVVPFDADPELTAGGSRFTLDGVEVELSVPGAHNARNAAAALLAARLAGADPARAAAALRDFQGAGRRFERLGRTAAGAEVVDDYAHHPDRGRRDARGRPDPRPPARRRRLPAAPVLAHRPHRRGVRRRARARRRDRRARHLPGA